jgi:ubiquinol-cytochrome c reductase cytochrome c subunit
MMKHLLAAGLALPILAIAAVSVHGSEPQVASGEALYAKYGCYACHGYAGGGGAMSGPALAGRGYDARSVFNYARSPKGVMPLYRKSVVSDAELNRIAEFVVRLPGARPVAQIPKLAQLQASFAQSPAPVADAVSRATASDDRARATAKAQFAGQCAACHGSVGQGGIAPALRGNPKAETAEQIMAAIRNPPQGMPRLTPSPIPYADVPALARYVERIGS